MNQIYNKTRTKRKYVRRPLCANIGKICTREKCRCDMAIKVPKTKAKMDENFLHREKVIKRRREIELNKLDVENAIINLKNAIDDSERIKGYVPPKKVNHNMLLNGLLIILASAILYPFVIVLIDLYGTR